MKMNKQYGALKTLRFFEEVIFKDLEISEKAHSGQTRGEKERLTNLN